VDRKEKGAGPAFAGLRPPLLLGGVVRRKKRDRGLEWSREAYGNVGGKGGLRGAWGVKVRG